LQKEKTPIFSESYDKRSSSVSWRFHSS